MTPYEIQHIPINKIFFTKFKGYIMCNKILSIDKVASIRGGSEMIKYLVNPLPDCVYDIISLDEDIFLGFKHPDEDYRYAI